MKFSTTTLLAALVPAISGRFVAPDEQDLVQLSPDEKYHIELSPGETRWVTEDEKLELRRDGRRFFDITDHPQLGALDARTAKKKVTFPEKVQQQDAIHGLLSNLSTTGMQAHLEKFTSFHTRYYKSEYGRQSSEWLLQEIRRVVADAGAAKQVSVEPFAHPWGQNSIIVTIPGKSNRTVVVGAHQDSINLWLPSVLPAPGADDDGSGTVTILEALRGLLASQDVIDGKADNTVEFHWYSAEEGGLLGSQAVFASYERAGRDVRAMLQQDMTGFVQGTLDAGKPESFGVMVDYVDEGLTAFIKKVIVEYCHIPFVETKCGYACSDHASAAKAGYPSGMVTEAAFELTDKHIHTVDDSISYLSFEHMLQHARMTLGLVYELGFTDFAKLDGHSADADMGEL